MKKNQKLSIQYIGVVGPPLHPEQAQAINDFSKWLDEREASESAAPGINWHKLEDATPNLNLVESDLKESDVVLVRVCDRYLDRGRMTTGTLHMPFPYTMDSPNQPGWWLDDGDTWVSLNQVTHWAYINQPDFSGGSNDD